MCGTVVATQPLKVVLTTDGTNVVAWPEPVGKPVVTVTADPVCTVFGAGLGALLTGPFGFVWGAATVAGLAHLVEFVASIIAAGSGPDLPPQEVGTVPAELVTGGTRPPSRPVVRLAEVTVTPDSVSVVSLIGVPRVFNDDRAVVRVRAETTRTPEGPPKPRTVDMPGTIYGCEPASFTATDEIMATRIDLSVETVNVAGISAAEATVQLGNFTTADGVLRNPEPRWEGLPVPLRAPGVLLRGQVHPNSAGRHAELVTGDVGIAVARTGDAAWRVEVSGMTGSFHLRFAVRITDAFDRVHEGETFVTVDGIDTRHPAAYDDYLDDCQDKLAAFVAQRVDPDIGRVGPVVVRPGEIVVRPPRFDDLRRLGPRLGPGLGGGPGGARLRRS